MVFWKREYVDLVETVTGTVMDLVEISEKIRGVLEGWGWGLNGKGVGQRLGLFKGIRRGCLRSVGRRLVMRRVG